MMKRQSHVNAGVDMLQWHCTYALFLVRTKMYDVRMPLAGMQEQNDSGVRLEKFRPRS
jgi:hypothetical protein